MGQLFRLGFVGLLSFMCATVYTVMDTVNILIVHEVIAWIGLVQDLCIAQGGKAKYQALSWRRQGWLHPRNGQPQ